MERKRKMLGELYDVPPNPFKYLMEHKNIIKKCDFIQNPRAGNTIYHIINKHVSYSLHSIDCNLADGEYILVPEQGVAQEVAQDSAPEPAIEDLPAPSLKGKPRFYA